MNENQGFSCDSHGVVKAVLVDPVLIIEGCGQCESEARLDVISEDQICG